MWMEWKCKTQTWTLNQMWVWMKCARENETTRAGHARSQWKYLWVFAFWSATQSSMCCVMQSSVSSLVFTFYFCSHLLLPTLCPNSHTVLVHPTLSRSHSFHMFFTVFLRHSKCGIYTLQKPIESKIKIRSIAVDIFASWAFMIRLVQTLKVVRHSRPPHSCNTCKYYELSCNCVCTELAEQEDQEGCPQQFGSRDIQYVDLPGTSWLDAHDVGRDDTLWISAWELRAVPHGAFQYSWHRLQKLLRCNTQRRSSSSVNRQEIGN